jgi:predicted dehydrogenase
MAGQTSIGWGVWGTGLTAQRVARDLSEVSGARLVAIGSRSADKARSLARDLGATQGVEGLAALLALADVDIVYVATPNHRHRDDCLAALAAGKHVLCEKPLAMTAADACEIAHAAAHAGRFCMEGLWTHFIPAVAEAERQLAAGAIGEPRLLMGSFGVPTLAPGAAAGPDGGALLDRGCYLISLALRLFGEVAAVDAQGTALSTSVTLTFRNGSRAMLTASMVEQLDNRFVVGGTGGALTLDDITCPTGLRVEQARPVGSGARSTGFKARLREGLRLAVRQSPLLARLRAAAGGQGRIIPCKGFGYVHEIEETQACIRAGRQQSAIHPLSRSIETLRIIEAAAKVTHG